MPLQFVALNRQLDTEVLGRYQALQTAGNGAEQLIALQMAANRLLDIKQRGKLRVSQSDISLGAYPLQLSARPGGEDFQDRYLGWRDFHRFDVEHGQVSDDVPPSAKQRCPQITFGCETDKIFVLRKERLEPLGIGADLPGDHVLARRAMDIEGDVLGKILTVPKGQGTHSRAGRVSAFGDERVTHHQDIGQVVHHRVKKIAAGQSGSAFGYSTQQLFSA